MLRGSLGKPPFHCKSPAALRESQAAKWGSQASRHTFFLPFRNGRETPCHPVNASRRSGKPLGHCKSPALGKPPCHCKSPAALQESQAATWGSQAPKAYLFSTFPKRTGNTLPPRKCFAAPLESHFATVNPLQRCGKARLPNGEARLPRHTFFLPFRNGRETPCYPAWRLQFLHRVVLLLIALQTSSASSFQSSLPSQVHELANFLCCMVSPRACYA